MDRIGRYQIVRELGRGAMGVVYLATDPTIGRQVAIKTIRLGEVSNTAERDRLHERLFREARSAGKLSHPGIITVYNMEEHGDVAFIAMEYVNGRTLDDLLSGGVPIPSSHMFSILGQTAVALDYAHQKGIVHRDIKPANIMIDEEGTVKIADFGIAKVNASEQFTMTGAILGTPHYMSPEQVQGQAVDGRSDQFSLSVIAYEMLTGEKPFTGDQLTTVVYKIVADTPPLAQRLNPTLSTQIETVLRKGLAKKPENRYPSCQKFLDGLEEACRGTKGWKTMVRGAGMSMPTASTERHTVALPPPRQQRAASTTAGEPARKSGFLPFLFAILAAAGLIALIAWQAGPWLTESQSRKAAAPPLADPSRPKPVETPPVEEPKPTLAPPVVEPGLSKPVETPPSEEPKPTPRPPPATELPKQEVHRPPPPETTGTIFLTGEPDGATIYVDGQPYEVTNRRIRLPLGTYTIEVDKNGQRTTQNVTVDGSIQVLEIHR
jgi:serine/threonine-protein kinase